MLSSDDETSPGSEPTNDGLTRRELRERERASGEGTSVSAAGGASGASSAAASAREESTTAASAGAASAVPVGAAAAAPAAAAGVRSAVPDAPASNSDPFSALFGDGSGDPETLTTSPHPAKPKPKRRRRALWITLGSIAAVIAIVVGVVVWNVAAALNQVERFDLGVEDANRPAPAQPDASGHRPLNILLIGTDARDHAQGDSIINQLGSRSDTMMLVHIPADRKNVQVMSIMRDSWVEIPGHGQAKVNAALSYGGVPMLVQWIEGTFGQRVDHAAIIDFEGFKGMTDAVGGVTVHNDIAFDTGNTTPALHFDQGDIKLDGVHALAFVRERYAYADGDYQRVRNQQAYLKGFMEQVLSRDTLTDPAKLTALLGAVTPYLAVDTSFDQGTMLGLGNELRGIRAGDVRMFTMPTTGTGMVGDQSVVFVDWPRIEEIKQRLANDTLEEYSP